MDGVRVCKISLWSFTKNFIKIKHQEAFQGSTYHPTLLLESWRAGMFLFELERLSGYRNIKGKIYWNFHQDPTSWSLSRLHLLSKSLPGVLEDRDVLDRDRSGVRVLKIYLGSFTESFIKIQHKEACQDSMYPPSLFLESWRRGMFLMELEMVSGSLKYPWKALQKVSSRSNIMKLVKTPSIVQVSSWSLGEQGCSWWS